MDGFMSSEERAELIELLNSVEGTQRQFVFTRPKPWSQMTADEKTALAHRTLHSMSVNVPQNQLTTTNPGPMPLDQLMFLAKVYEATESEANRE